MFRIILNNKNHEKQTIYIIRNKYRLVDTANRHRHHVYTPWHTQIGRRPCHMRFSRLTDGHNRSGVGGHLLGIYGRTFRITGRIITYSWLFYTPRCLFNVIYHVHGNANASHQWRRIKRRFTRHRTRHCVSGSHTYGRRPVQSGSSDICPKK